MSWRALGPAQLALILLLVSSCGASGSSGQASYSSEEREEFLLEFGQSGGALAYLDSAVQSCLAAKGFTLESSVQRAHILELNASRSALTAREFASEYGYGIATTAQDMASAWVEDNDPAQRAGLQESEFDDYYRALHGSLEPNAEPGGCLGQASSELDAFYALEGALIDYENAHPPVQSTSGAEQEWQTCMSSRGWKATSPAWPEEFISSELARILDTAVLTLADGGSSSLTRVAAGDRVVKVDLDAERLGALKETERTLAIDDLECGRSELSTEAEGRNAELVEGFSAENATTLDNAISLASEFDSKEGNAFESPGN